MPLRAAGQKAGCAGRGADIDSRAGLLIGGGTIAVTQERFLAGVGTCDLVAQLRRGIGHGDRAGAYDLPLRQGPVEARERFSLGAGEAQTAVALGSSAMAREPLGDGRSVI